MPESTKTIKKKRPAWLNGEDAAQAPKPGSRPATGGKGPLAEGDTSEIPTAVVPPPADEAVTGAPTKAMPQVSASGAGERSSVSASPQGGIMERLRSNPVPLLLILVVLAALVWFLFLGDGGGSGETGEQQAGVPGQSTEDPFGGGPVRESGVVFSALEESGDDVELAGAGLDWEGSVAEKQGGSGETVTLEGATAAQIERGFDLDASDVETGVYAVAQENGQVLHVTTQTFVPQEEGAEAEELTLGTVYALDDGELSGFAYYLDQRQEGSDTVTRTYVRPGQSSYRVSYEAEPTEAADADDRNGTFVPLLVGWRGFEDGSTSEQGGE